MSGIKLSISEISPEDDQSICNIIKQVGEEFGAIGEGFGPSDPEVEQMSSYYSDKSASRYYVARIDNKIVGGGGVASFNDSDSVCELKKLFILPEARGFGLGTALTKACLDYANKRGYQQCYLDTLSNMEPAIRLYSKLGFQRLEKPLQGTIHNRCDVWMIKTL